MANAANLINFGGSTLSVGDWTYSAVPLSAPAYLPLNNDTASYLVSSYPTLGASYVTPATAYAAATFTAPNTPGGFIDMAYGNGIYVAIGGGGISVSRNGTTWNARILYYSAGAASATLRGIWFANGVFVISAIKANATAVGTQFFTSSDGITWSRFEVEATLQNTMYPLFSAGNWYAFSGSGSGTYRSTDNGFTWNGSVVVTGSTGRAVNGTTIVVGNNSVTGSDVNYSTDGGGNFFTATTPVMYFGSIAYGNGLFVGVDTRGTASTTAAYSSDGITWNSATLPSAIWKSVAFANGVFFATSSSGTIGATSTNGSTWTSVTLPTSAVAMVAMCAGGPTNNKIFVAMPQSGTTGFTVNYAVTQTTFTLPVVPTMKNVTPYIKAS